MATPSPSMRDLARRLLAASRAAADPPVHDAVAVCETLRMALTRFAGADGFAALLRRSLALAGSGQNDPELQTDLPSSPRKPSQRRPPKDGKGGRRSK